MTGKAEVGTVGAPAPSAGPMVPAFRAPDALPVPAGFDPFQLMDRFDEEALIAEMQGRVATALIYVVKDKGQEVTGLSKEGVDECCMALVSQGQVIREEELEYEIRGAAEDQEALFKCRASRYAVSSSGGEARLDTVIGVKRQPLYYEAQQLDLDSRVPGKKYKGKTYRDLMDDPEGRDYLGWMSENFSDPAIKDFVRALLNGEDVMAQSGRRMNPHWYEQGAMKAARNARFRLIPGKIRAAVIESARAFGGAKVKEVAVERGGPEAAKPGGDPLGRIAAVILPGSPGKWGGYAGKTLGETPSEILKAAAEWATGKGSKAEQAQNADEAQRAFGLARQCDLIIAAREGGQLTEPPHKDGTPRDPTPAAPPSTSSSGGAASTPAGKQPGNTAESATRTTGTQGPKDGAATTTSEHEEEALGDQTTLLREPGQD